jgi:predicted RNA methylase
MREALRSGQLVEDRQFDLLYPLPLRRVSQIHWTPVEIAMRAARLLAKEPGSRLLDVGAGVGKFCVIAAATVRASVSGIEHRGRLVEIADDVAIRIGVDVTFRHGTLADCDPRDFDGVYLFNPFAENMSARDDHLDDTVELSEWRYWRDVATTERFLREARAGTRVVTYCGWGGSMPPEYRLAFRGRNGGTLDLWIKTGCVDRRPGRLVE